MTRISFLLVICLIVFPFIILQGCMKAITSEQIRGNLVEVSKNIESYSYETEMYMETSLAGEHSPEIVNSNRNAHVHVKNKRMKISINVDEWTTDKTKSKSTQRKNLGFSKMSHFAHSCERFWDS